MFMLKYILYTYNNMQFVTYSYVCISSFGGSASYKDARCTIYAIRVAHTHTIYIQFTHDEYTHELWEEWEGARNEFQPL